MSTNAFCPWCDEYHPRNAPCPPPTNDPEVLSLASVPVPIRQQAPPTLQPTAPVAAAVATAAPSITNAAADQLASKLQMPTTTSRPAPPRTHPHPSIAAATQAPINPSTTTDQPPSTMQAEPQAGPSQPRSLKRKEAPAAYEHYTITDHDTPTQRAQREQKYKADALRHYQEKKQRLEENREEQTGQAATAEEDEEVAKAIAEGGKGLEVLSGPISVVLQRLIRAMAGWKAKAERLQAEKEVMMGLLEEEGKKREELELWRRNTMEPF